MSIQEAVTKNARDFFNELEEPALTKLEAKHHTKNFMAKYYDQTRLGSQWGYTPELALKAQLEEYCRDLFGWSDPREGI